MGAPLAAISRRSVGVRLYDRFGFHDPAGMAPALIFASAQDAQAYLRHWLPDAAALMALRNALYRCEQSLPVFSFSDEHLIRVLSRKLAQGTLLITEGEPPPAGGGWPLVPVAPAPAPDSTVLINLDALPVRPPLPPPLLPVLEELQIEGAEVLPEIEQTLEQIALTMGSIDLAGVSLEPTPSKVPPIETTMTDAAGSVTRTLDEL